MPPPKPRRKGRGAFFGLVLGAAALMAAGGYLAVGLRLSHQPIDLAYSEGPRAFQAWLSRTWRAVPGGGDLAAGAAGRLMSMPIAARRRTVAAMADEAFWNGVAADETSRRSLQTSMREAVLQSLRQAPAAGDLWLAAASLHARLDGFDGSAARYLAASYRFAPREGQVAYGRARLIVHVLPVLDGPLAEAAASDLALIEATYPRLYRALATALQMTEARR